LKTLSVETLLHIQKANPDTVLKKVFDYCETNSISFDNLIEEIKGDFSEDKQISVNSKEESEAKQIAINSLEDESNEYRVIFAVDKLNEGWDVLNLFDIVRLYDTRDAKKGVPGKTTMQEAQLIGRGARYCPFNSMQANHCLCVNTTVMKTMNCVYVKNYITMLHIILVTFKSLILH
jgi:type III restriction enzyme